MKPHLKSAHLIFAVLLMGFAEVFADPTLMLSSSDPETVKARISELRELRNAGNLSSSEQQSVDALWEQAALIEEMNDRCGSIDLTESYDSDCGHFYEIELPKFETELFKLTGEIRLSSTRLSKAMEDKRKSINVCYEALQVDAFHPSRILTLNGKYSPEPLSHGVEISYDFRLEANRDVVSSLKERMQEWYEACGEIILRSDGSNEIAPLFQEKINERTNSNLYFELDRDYNGFVLYVKSKSSIQGDYILNGTRLFQYSIPSAETIATLKFVTDRYYYDDNSRYRKYIAFVDIKCDRHFDGKKIFSDDSVERGLRGQFIWAKARARHPSRTSSNNDGSTSVDDSSVDADIDSKASDESSTFFQVLAGLNLGMGSGAGINPSLRDEYYDVWRQDSEWADTSLLLLEPYITGMLTFEFGRNTAFGIGGGIAWLIASVSESDAGYYGETYDQVNLRTSIAPVIQAEFSLGDPTSFSGGIRETFIFDSDWPSNYLGGFLELINLVGIEMGWNHAEGFWDAFYLGFYIKLPPRHFSEIGKNKN